MLQCALTDLAMIFLGFGVHVLFFYKFVAPMLLVYHCCPVVVPEACLPLKIDSQRENAAKFWAPPRVQSRLGVVVCLIRLSARVSRAVDVLV